MTSIIGETVMPLILGSISKDLGKIWMLLTRSRTYDLPMTNSLGCPSIKVEEIHENKTIKETIMAFS